MLGKNGGVGIEAMDGEGKRRPATAQRTTDPDPPTYIPPHSAHSLCFVDVLFACALGTRWNRLELGTMKATHHAVLIPSQLRSLPAQAKAYVVKSFGPSEPEGKYSTYSYRCTY